MSDLPPLHPGEIIRRTCLQPRGLSVTRAAQGLGVTRKALSELLNGKSGVSPEMAIRLAKAFGDSPEHWLQKQLQYDLWRAERSLSNLQVHHFDDPPSWS